MNSNEMVANITVLKLVHYVLFVVQCLLVTLLIMYLILSKFNAKTFKETFASKKRIVVYVLVSIVLTAGFTVGCAFLTNYLVRIRMSSATEEMQPGEMGNGIQPGSTANSSSEYTGKGKTEE